MGGGGSGPLCGEAWEARAKPECATVPWGRFLSSTGLPARIPDSGFRTTPHRGENAGRTLGIRNTDGHAGG